MGRVQGRLYRNPLLYAASVKGEMGTGESIITTSLHQGSFGRVSCRLAAWLEPNIGLRGYIYDVGLRL
jgi:hypothetical protein